MVDDYEAFDVQLTKYVEVDGIMELVGGARCKVADDVHAARYTFVKVETGVCFGLKTEWAVESRKAVEIFSTS